MTSFLSLTDINLNSPNKGVLSDFMTDVPVGPGVASRAQAVEGLTEVEEEELRAELAKVPWFYFLFWCDDETLWVMQRVEHGLTL